MKRNRQDVRQISMLHGSLVANKGPQFDNLVAVELRTGLVRIRAELVAGVKRLGAEWALMRERMAIQRKLRRQAKELERGIREVDWLREELMNAERNQSALELLYRANEEQLLARLAQLDGGL
ncbi:hypothetical protein [Ralstonia mannitolilytica]|uniref:hypothetical protein n=1 Tax=Ralstonia mannitolilytica TaxID=105219 RepID=UPI000CED8324|nr:hypothetical protein [Ralstonia mannitolilytica]